MEDDLSPELLKLKTKLARFVVAEKKKEVEKYLRRKRNLLMSLPLIDNGMEVTLEQAIKDAAREKLVFNDGEYRGGWDELHRLRADLLELAAELVASPECTTALSAEDLANLVLIKSSRTRNGGDAYVRTRLIFEPSKGDWVLKPLDRDTYPIDIKLFPHGKAIFAQVSTMNQYGLYRMEDLMEGDSATPWLPIDAVVVEQIDLNNDRTHRDLRILASLDGPVRRRFIDRLFFRPRSRRRLLQPSEYPKPPGPISSFGSETAEAAPVRSPPPQVPALASPSPNRLALMGADRYAQPIEPAVKEEDEEKQEEEEEEEEETSAPSNTASLEQTAQEVDVEGRRLTNKASDFALLNPDDMSNIMHAWFGDQPNWFEPDNAVADWFRGSTPTKVEKEMSKPKGESNMLDFDWTIMTGDNDWMFGLFTQQEKAHGETEIIEEESSSGEEVEDDDDELDVQSRLDEGVGEGGEEEGDDEGDKPLSLAMLLDNHTKQREKIGHLESKEEEEEEEVDDELGELLSSMGLSHFHLPLLGVGIHSLQQLRNSPDSLLSTCGLRKGHILKLRRGTGEQRAQPEIRMLKSYKETRAQDDTALAEREHNREPTTPFRSFRQSSNDASYESPQVGRRRAATMSAKPIKVEDEGSLPVFPPFMPPQMQLPESAHQLMVRAPTNSMAGGPSFDRNRHPATPTSRASPSLTSVH